MESTSFPLSCNLKVWTTHLGLADQDIPHHPPSFLPRLTWSFSASGFTKPPKQAPQSSRKCKIAVQHQNTATRTQNYCSKLLSAIVVQTTSSTGEGFWPGYRLKVQISSQERDSLVGSKTGHSKHIPDSLNARQRMPGISTKKKDIITTSLKHYAYYFLY